MAHGDASSGSSGPNNTTLFARELTQLRDGEIEDSNENAQETLTALLRKLPLPQSTFPYLASMSGPDLVATLFTLQVPLNYGGEGEGLFVGVERYHYLHSRLVDASTSCSTFATAWGYLAKKLQLSMPKQSSQPALLALYGLPKPIQAAALTAINKSPEMIIMTARMIAEGLKATSVNYAEIAGKELEVKDTYQITEEQLSTLQGRNGRSLVTRIPAISGNSLRHSLVRAPGATRLLQELNLVPGSNLPIGVERFLYAGGNTAKGAKAPGAADVYEATMRANYPLVDALGGSSDQFVLTRSQLSIASWIVCRENNWITEKKTGGEVRSETSIFDLVGEVTRTRGGIGGKDKESGQMIFNYETLAAHSQVLVEVGWQPYTRPLIIGFTLQALLDWQDEGGAIGARSAQGHSALIADFPSDERWAHAAEYLSYLRDNKDKLRHGLVTGTFGSEVALCTA